MKLCVRRQSNSKAGFTSLDSAWKRSLPYRYGSVEDLTANLTADNSNSMQSDATFEKKQLVDVDTLTAELKQFADARDWAQFHSPKNLAMALTGEVGELTEIFQWMSEEDSKEAARNPNTAQAVKDELADVLMYLVRLSSVLGVDLDEAVRQKLKSNAAKYPIDKALGTSKKYNEL
jgi:dCTP diphosphatase